MQPPLQVTCYAEQKERGRTPCLRAWCEHKKGCPRGTPLPHHSPSWRHAHDNGIVLHSGRLACLRISSDARKRMPVKLRPWLTVLADMTAFLAWRIIASSFRLMTSGRALSIRKLFFESVPRADCIAVHSCDDDLGVASWRCHPSSFGRA